MSAFEQAVFWLRVIGATLGLAGGSYVLALARRMRRAQPDQPATSPALRRTPPRLLEALGAFMIAQSVLVSLGNRDGALGVLLDISRIALSIGFLVVLFRLQRTAEARI